MMKVSAVGAHGSLAVATVQTIPVPDGSTGVLLQAGTQNVRITLDGTTPTATVGFQLATANGVQQLPVNGGMVIKAVQETGGGILQFQFIREYGR
jgi:hypothetical protein